MVAAALAGLLAGCASDRYSVPVRETGADSPSSSSKTVHAVRRGDTLYSIAWDAGLDYRALARWNDIPPPYVIRPGQRLRLRPAPGYRAPSTASTRPATRAPAAKKPTSRPDPGGALQSGPPQDGWIWPTSGPVIRKFSPKEANPGIDIAGQAGQTVKSAADGRVVYSGDGLRGYGQLIIVKHNETFLSAYAHNRKLLVGEGQRVRRGQPIAEMGATGTDRVKLHFEIRREGTAVNPLQYLPRI